MSRHFGRSGCFRNSIWSPTLGWTATVRRCRSQSLTSEYDLGACWTINSDDTAIRSLCVQAKDILRIESCFAPDSFEDSPPNVH